MTPFDFAVELDRLVRGTPPADDAESRRWLAAFAELYPVQPWRRWVAREARKRQAARQQETPR